MKHKTIQHDVTSKPMRRVHHKQIQAEIQGMGYRNYPGKLPYEGYAYPFNLKRIVYVIGSLNELYKYIVTDRHRTNDNLRNAKKNGVELIFIISNEEGYVFRESFIDQWHNPLYDKMVAPRKKREKLNTAPPKPVVSNLGVIKAIEFLESKYNTRFIFCTKANTTKLLISLLEEYRD